MRSLCFDTVFMPTSPTLVNTETKLYTLFAMSMDCMQTNKTEGAALSAAHTAPKVTQCLLPVKVLFFNVFSCNMACMPVGSEHGIVC